MNKKALILVDFVNEIVNPDGKLSKKGYSDFVNQYNVDKNVVKILKKVRDSGDLIIHVRVGFDPTYIDHPVDSPLFGSAKKFLALDSSSWGFDFVNFAKPIEGEVVIRKSRVSPFFGTSLDLVLRNNDIKTLLIAGCSTDLAIQSTVRDAHDRDFNVNVVSECCAAATIEDHEASIAMMKKNCVSSKLRFDLIVMFYKNIY